jgi:4-hydroxy-tetrahydrodipicolinate synthase
MFVETNPAPVKHALSVLGFMTDELRLPLVPVTPPSARIIEAALKKYGLSMVAEAKA